MYVLYQVPHVGTNHVSVRVADVRSDKRAHARSDFLSNNKPQPFAFGQTHHGSTDIGSHGDPYNIHGTDASLSDGAYAPRCIDNY